MGVGNYWLENALTVYIDNDEIIDSDECFEQEYFLDFVENIRSLIPVKSFRSTERYVHAYRESRLVIAENGLYQISVIQWESYIAVNIELRPAHYTEPWEFNPLGVYHHAGIAKKLFDALARFFCLRVRTSGWTSGPYIRA